MDMYNANKKHFLNIADYIETLDCCFVLGMVRLNENGELIYVS
ncbi:ABC-three component system middle component 7 [Limosilactobacillus reuteri]